MRVQHTSVLILCLVLFSQLGVVKPSCAKALSVCFLPVSSSHFNRLLDALKEEDVPLSVIESLVDENPEVLKYKEMATPLHYVAAGWMPVSFEVLRYLVRKCPEALEITDMYGNIPLHRACTNLMPLEVIRLLLEAYPEGAKRKGEKGRTALHRLAWGNNDHLESVKLLMGFFPHAAYMQDNNGDTPLHFGSYFYRDPNPKVIQYLATKRPISCLLYNKAREYPNEKIGLGIQAPRLPLDMAQSLLGALEPQVDVVTCVTQATVDAGCGLLDACLSPSSGLPRDVAAVVQESLLPDIVASINAKEMVTHEAVGLPTIKELVKIEAVQSMLRDEEYASVIHGFIEMRMDAETRKV